MPCDQQLEQRVRQFFDSKRIKHETKRMMGGLCFMVNSKMCVGFEKNRLMARKGCRPMDFTGRPMRGFVFVELAGLKSEKDLGFWLELALAYNPTAKKSSRKKS